MNLLDVQTNFDKILDVLKLWGSIAITVTGLVMAVKVIAKEISFRKKADDKLIVDVAEVGNDIENIKLTVEQNKGKIAVLESQIEIMRGHYQNLLNDLIDRHKTTRNR